MTVTARQAAATLKRRWAAEAAKDEAAADTARAVLPRLAQIALERGAKRVFVFGSLVEGRFHDQTSDIDLAVEGLPEQALYGLMAALSMLAERHVDVVPIEEASSSLVGRIRRTGREIT